MHFIPEILANADEMVSIRHDLHANPELGFEEFRTSAIVSDYLQALGIEVHQGIGGTGVVGVIEGAEPGPRIVALRADMDALPIEESTGLPYASVNRSVCHACGHDAHTTMLLGAAKYLAASRNFAGTAILIFQPAEEGLGGARAMIADKLFERFPFDEIYALHNAPHLLLGQVSVFAGPVMAGADTFEIKIKGLGSHAAKPERSKDPVIAAVTMAQALQSIISRNIDPQTPAVLSITELHTGSAFNIIPQEAVLRGTIRAFSTELRGFIGARIRDIGAGLANMYGVSVDVEVRDVFTALHNHPEQTRAVENIARALLGSDKVLTTPRPVMSSEDFADMLKTKPGAYFWLGHGGGVPVHNPSYIFNDAALPLGASLLARIVETRCSRPHSEPV